MKKPEPPSKGCNPESGCCGPEASGLGRRDFLKTTSLGAALMMVPGVPLFAGPFDENDYLKYVPLDKKLDPRWVASLFERGKKETYSDPQALRQIGMPVGGLFAGTVYLSGDGRLWLWDIFNRDQEGVQARQVEFGGQSVGNRNGANFIEPAKSVSPFKQGFSIEVNGRLRALDASGFSSVTFDGRYPVGKVTFRDPDCEVEVILECFSPFIPLEADRSSLPATIMSYSVINLTDKPLDVVMHGYTANPVCHDSAGDRDGTRYNRVVEKPAYAAIECSAGPPPPSGETLRDDILFEDFEDELFDNWFSSGDAFGIGPIRRRDIPDYQGNVGGSGDRVVNSHAAASGENVSERDSKTGVLVSREFTIQRKFITFDIGGGSHPEKTCIELIVNDQVLASVTGNNDNRMQRKEMATADLEGQTARLRIVDSHQGGWGHIGVDHIVFSDIRANTKALEELRDFGTFSLALLQPENHKASADERKEEAKTARTEKLSDEVTGKISAIMRLEAKSRKEVTWCFAWHFPNFYGRVFGGVKVGHHYAALYSSALDVVNAIATDPGLLATTRLWVETWYDSSLPYWLLDRTMANTTTLATTTCYRHFDGRFWAWEGIGCCEGTCTHVWHYAQAPGRLFPEVERDQRERIDFGMALKEDGVIGYRAMLDYTHGPAFDGQCGRILGVLREHQMSANNEFLQRLYPGVKLALKYLIQQDANADGIIEGAQPNTLDASWYGKIPFISSLYLAALRAGQQMAMEMGDSEFAGVCSDIAEKGEKTITELYDGEYFIQEEDPEHKDVIGVGNGCYIDQIFGQTWAHWVGLGYLFDRNKQLSALRSLWKYNFVPDLGPFRRHFKAGRWYAMAGDGGLIMCSWPKGGKRDKWEDQWQFMYFNECMSGFEWQAAAHMIYEGMDQPDILQNGLAVSRAIHDRYNARLRNPYNEIECSDHYSRAMASYGVFQAVCGFQHDGPKGMVRFDPRLHPEKFKAPFVTAEGWGTYQQEQTEKGMVMSLKLRHGSLSLSDFHCRKPDKKVTAIKLYRNKEQIGLKQVDTDGNTMKIRLDKILLQTNDQFTAHLICS